MIDGFADSWATRRARLTGLAGRTDSFGLDGLWHSIAASIRKNARSFASRCSASRVLYGRHLG